MNREELLERVKKEVPESPGVYIMKNVGDEVIYVGKAKILKRRMKSYFDGTPKTQKTYALVSNIDHFDYILTNSEVDAFSLECNLIKKYMPKYNILLKDDKSFPYIKIDLNERYPRIQIARRPKPEKNVLLFGPYVTGTRIGELVSLIKSAYPIRWCNINFDAKPFLERPCIHGEIGNCNAPCLSEERAKIYMDNLNKVIDFLNGKTGDIKKALKEKMNRLAEIMKFEEALVVRNQIRSIETMEKELITNLSNESDIDVYAIAEQDETYCINLMMIRKGKNVGQINYPILEVVGESQDLLLQFMNNHYKDQNILPKEIVTQDLDDEHREMIQGTLLVNFNRVVKVTNPKIGVKKELVENCKKNALEELSHSKARIQKRYEMTVEALEKLKNLLGLKRLKRIEGYDISNISGEFSVASMVVFENGEPAYKEYRKFKIKTVVGSDDFASMKETLKRRLTDYVEQKENFSKRPDLILIDGGYGQLHSAYSVVEEMELDIPMISLAKRDEEICTTKNNIPIKLKKSDYVLRLLQRVRDESHRFAITFHRNLRGKSLKSSLTEIEGLGDAKITALIRAFKSVEAISKASSKDLEKVEGIGPVLAQTIFDYYHETVVK
ncbi:MAG: excinuclease ABC subunit UvrC [Clostridia bacterium]|nr:excinuclease ABC subunit UvrC [Clostridia bacterium]